MSVNSPAFKPPSGWISYVARRAHELWAVTNSGDVYRFVDGVMEPTPFVTGVTSRGSEAWFSGIDGNVMHLANGQLTTEWSGAMEIGSLFAVPDSSDLFATVGGGDSSGLMKRH